MISTDFIKFQMSSDDFINFVQTNPSSEMLAEQFDVQGFIKAQAADIAMGAPDHYARVANNFYLYFNYSNDPIGVFINI